MAVRRSTKIKNKITARVAAYRASRRRDGREGGIRSAGQSICETDRDWETS